jgi:GDP/UDP-N,N'-diacetylbacillosamine 2-epimerase (hydrolysing)
VVHVGETTFQERMAKLKDRRLILGVTGIRSEYDIMSSVFKAIKSNPGLELELFVTGAHLSDSHGGTIQEIYRDGFTIADEVESLLSSDRPSGRVKGLATQIQGLVQTVSRLQPDFLLVLGDREEAMATALVGAYMNVPVAHIGGGDRVVGNVDDQVRHAVTKLSHLHFATNAESAQRIVNMGEQKFRVFNTGNPGLDRFISVPTIELNQLSRKIGFSLENDEPYVMMLQHVISTEFDQAYEQIKASLEAIKDLGIKTIVIHPNSDAGSQQLVRAIKEYETLPFIHVVPNIPRLEFVNLIRNTSCLLGNSSAGILEAPFLNLPVINVGNRQIGRMHAENVQFVPHEKNAIIAALRLAIFDTQYKEMVANCSNPYGDGNSSERIAGILGSVDIDEKLLIKDIAY